MTSKDNDQESLTFWSSIIETLSGSSSDLKDDRYPEISSPIMMMSTPMAVNVQPQPCSPPRDGYKKVGPEKSKDKEIEKCKKKEKYAKIEGKSLGKRPRRKSRSIADRRLSAEIKKQIHKLRQMTIRGPEKDTLSTLDSIIEYIRGMKLFVESQSAGPMLPLDVDMDFPGPWLPLNPHNSIIPGNGFTQGEPSVQDHQIVPADTKGLNNQPKSFQSME